MLREKQQNEMLAMFRRTKGYSVPAVMSFTTLEITVNQPDIQVIKLTNILYTFKQKHAYFAKMLADEQL